MSPYTPLGCNRFLVFDDLDKFEEHWAGILKNVSQFGFVSWFEWSNVFLKKRLRDEVPFLLCHFKGTHYQHGL